MDRGTKIKVLLGQEITEMEKELMPFLELQDKFELTEKEKDYIIKQHMVARQARDYILRILDNQINLKTEDKKEITKNAQKTFDIIMKETYNTILQKRK